MSGEETDKVVRTICIIGAGSSGLTAIKSCKEEGLHPVCFERSNWFGGVWHFSDDDQEGEPSVMKSTVINTSKELSAFSDFPPPDHFANYMHNSYMLQYFKLYAEHFDLFKHIRYKHEVIHVDMAEDYDVSGRWVVTTRNLNDMVEATEVFDGVMVCSGHHTFPYMPELPGLKDFKGQVLHTHSLKSANGLEGKNVLVVGIGNSAVDAAVEVCNVSQKLYLSSRRGSWIYARLGPKGIPFDVIGQNRLLNFILKWDPLHTLEYVLQTYLSFKFDHEKFGLKPKHGVLGAHATVNDALPNCIMSGKVILKQNIEHFTGDGVIFDGEQQVVPLDVVILATGYQIKFPFLSDKIMKVNDNSVNLYKLVFPPHLPHPSLSFIGLIQPLGSIFPIAEAQSRWFAHMTKNSQKLPSETAMLDDIRDRNSRNWKQFVYSPRHTIQVMWIPYMDEICSQFGAMPNFYKMALSDPRLYWACLWGPCTPYTYRLQGPHCWKGAREAILTTWDRIQAPLGTCKRVDD